jgi:hypothetical protein
MSGFRPRSSTTAVEAGAPRYEKGDRVWVRTSRSAPLPGLVIGHYVDWNLYRIVYMVGVAGQDPRAVEEWRLSPRQADEEC